MGKTLLTIRIFFFLLCMAASFLVCYAVKDWDEYQVRAILIGGGIGALVVLVDIFLKGFSLRGLTALTFGLFVGWLMAFFISTSPLFEQGDPQTLFLSRLALYLIVMYLATVIALRGKDEFNLVIPYMRFVPHNVETPLAVIDTSALIDGRIEAICRSGFFSYALVIPRFVLDELHLIADSNEPTKQERGRRGLEVLNRLREIEHLDIRIHESDVEGRQNVDAKLIFLAQSMRAKILTTDYNLARMAEFQNVGWLNINALTKALVPELSIGQTLEVELVKQGKESNQAVGFLGDGSMVVVNDAHDYIGTAVAIEVQSILPSAGGKMVFGKVIGRVER